MTRYKVTAPNPSYSGEFATLVFRRGEADADTPADQVALDYCRRRGYDVTAVDEDGETLPEAQQPDEDTPDPDAFTPADEDDDELGVVVDEPTRPADYATKGEWVTYAIHRGATREDAEAATKNDLIDMYGKD
jgi:hypothetical protein